jgi:hypothetical protein
MKLKASTSAESVLLYGPGMKEVAHTLPFPVWTFDDGDRPPRSADLVVFQGMPLEKEVLMDLKRVIRKVGYLVLDSKEEIHSIGTSLHIAKVLKSDKYHLIVGPRKKQQMAVTRAA